MGKRKKIGKIIPKMPSRFAKQKGKAPGTITYMGRRENLKSIVNILDYNENGFNVSAPGNVDAIVSHKGPPLVSWIDIVGLSDEAFIAKIGERFGLNPLVMEDIVNTNQRPKIDEYDPYIFGVFKMLYINQDKELIGEHIALVLLDNCVLVFQELEYDVFTGVRDRVTKKFGRIRSRGSDYLFFALLDSIVDNYFAVLEYLNDKIE
ncbi:hypothetical protein LCGC14_1975730, partial [marine sediment metagenome]